MVACCADDVGVTLPADADDDSGALDLADSFGELGVAGVVADWLNEDAVGV